MLLDATQRAFFAEHGWLVVRAAVSRQRARELEHALDEIYQAGPPPPDGPGDLSIHHCLTLHRSGENRSARARKTLITRLFDGECRLVRERLPPGADMYFPVDDNDHLADSAFPIVYRTAA